MSELKESRYVVKMAAGETSQLPKLQSILDDCPNGFSLHSITPWASGSGYVDHFVVVFERDQIVSPGAPSSGKPKR